MEQLGKVVEWNEARGYGFIQPLDEAVPRLFFHVRDYRLDGRRPEVGELVKFDPQRQDDGRWRGVSVRRVVTTPRTRGGGQHIRRRVHHDSADWSGRIGWPLLALHLGLLAWSWWTGRLPVLPALGLLGLCTATWIAYALDKHAAKHGNWRTPESTLHLLALVGGWPGAWLAQRVLRHKSRKENFQIVFWCTVGFNVFVTWMLLLRAA